MKGLGGWLAGALLAILPGPAAAAAQVGAPPIESPLQAAREEAGEPPRAPQTYALAAGELHVAPSELLASSVGRRITFTATLDRPQPGAELTVRLPAAWSRTPASGIRASRPPRPLAGDRIARAGSVVRLRFPAGERRVGFSLENRGIPAGTYELPLSFRAPSGRAVDAGRAQVRIFANVRERVRRPGDEWRGVPRAAINASNDGFEQSEVFVGIAPRDERRFALGINGSQGMTAYVTEDGGATFDESQMPASTDAPDESTPEISDICCDPMYAANDAGDLWFGGLSFANPVPPPGNPAPSRIVVSRIPAGATTFQSQTVGLKVRTNGTQDKPLMTIDNSPSSPSYGRLYVVWDEPFSGPVRLVVSRCDTRPAGLLNAARCDNADNWTTPETITQGSLIYADVAAGPDGRVFVTWWDYSNANAIRGAAAQGGTGFGAPQNIALLDNEGGVPIPFGCPILVQPGGRVGPVPGVEVDRSHGPNRGRVYVSWSDLNGASGTTRCREELDGTYSPPAATHDRWDSLVKSRAGGLPGLVEATTNLLASSADSDDFFPWLAVDQSTGDAWADFYSTRLDGSRTTTHFWARSVSPNGSGGHDLGTLVQTSSVASSYASAQCCEFGNDFGDYEAIDAARCVPIPGWSDNSTGSGDGEAFAFDSLRLPVCFRDETTLAEGPGGDGDGLFEPGETVVMTVRLTNAGDAGSAAVSGQLTSTEAGDVTVIQGATTWPPVAAGATADPAGTLSVEVPDAGCSPTTEVALEFTAGPREQTSTLQLPIACVPVQPTPTPSPSAAPTATPIATVTPVPTVTPDLPRGLNAFRIGSRQRLGTVLRRGLLATLSCRGDCVVVLALTVDARTARRYRVPRRIARMTLRLVDGNVRSQRIKLSSRARRNLRNARSLRAVASATVAVASGGAPRSLSRRVTLRR